MIRRGIGGRQPALTLAQVRELYAWASYGTSRVEVARRLGVSPATVLRYLRGVHKRPEYVEARRPVKDHFTDAGKLVREVTP